MPSTRNLKPESSSIHLQLADESNESNAIARCDWKAEHRWSLNWPDWNCFRKAKTKNRSAVKFAGEKSLKLTQELRQFLVGLETPVEETAGKTLRVKLKAADFTGLRITTTSNPTAATRASLPKESAKRLEHFRGQWSGFSEARGRQQQLLEEKKKIEAAAPLTMIASDMPSPRTNYLLMRG